MAYKRLISGECHVETIKNIVRAIDTFDRLKGVIIQFWALIGECSSGFLLSTSKQPFAPRNPEPDLYKYRSRCVKYAYSSSDSSSSSSSSPSNSCRNIILNGLVGDAFQGHSVKVVKDLSVHRGGPLVDCALECGLTSSVLIPCYSNDAGAGVVECCLVNPAHLSGILKLLELAFMNMHLKWPTLQSISDLKHDHGQLGIEIDDALQAVCKTHNLALGQVWMFSKLPWDCNTYTSQSFVFRLSSFHNDDSDDDAIKAYYDISSLPFQMKQTLPGMAFQTKKPFFLPSMLFGSTSCSCFVIRLNNYIHPCCSYAFEFIWPQCKNYLKLLESVLLTLEGCLPSFNLRGLVTHGGELSVLNADDFEGHVCGCFNVVLKDNRFSGIPIKPSYEESTISNLEVNQHDQSTVGDADTNTNAQGLPPKPVKLFFTDMNMVAIVKKVKKEMCTFDLSWQDEHPLASIKRLIEKELLLYPNRYKMTVDCEGESRSLESEKDFEDLKDHLEKTRTSVFDVRVEPIKKGSKISLSSMFDWIWIF